MGVMVGYRDNRYKVVLLGDSGVGKSSLLLQFTESYYRPLTSTIGIDYKKSTMIIENQAITLEIWDTGGQERYRSLTRNHFKNAQGVVLMYSVDNTQSYLSLSQWQADIERYCPPQTRVLIIGNKCDLPTRTVPVEQGLMISSRLGAPFMESSAKENINVRTTFRLLAKMMMDERKATIQDGKMEKLLEEKLIRLEKCDCCQRSVDSAYKTCCDMA